MQTMMASANLIELLKQYEGFKPDADLCVSGKKHPDGSPMYDIGYGCQYWEDGERVQLGDSISRPEAEALKRSRIAKEFEPDILEYMGDITFGPNMWDALVSAWYNLRAPRTQPIMKAIRDGEYGQHVEMTRPLAERWMLYSDRKNPDIRKGLWRRRGAEVLMANGLPDPYENSQTLDFEQPIWPMVERLRSEQGWMTDDDLVEAAPTPPSPKPEPTPDALPEDWAEKTPNEQTRWLNLRSLRKAGGEVAPAPVKVRPPVEVVELNDVPYISNPTPKSKKVADSRRGKGFAKQEVAKHAGFVAAGGWAAESVGAVEPTVKFVEKYSSQTIAWVFLAIGVFAVGYYFFGKWQQQLGEDEAEDHLH